MSGIASAPESSIKNEDSHTGSQQKVQALKNHQIRVADAIPLTPLLSDSFCYA